MFDSEEHTPGRISGGCGISICISQDFQKGKGECTELRECWAVVLHVHSEVLYDRKKAFCGNLQSLPARPGEMWQNVSPFGYFVGA